MFREILVKRLQGSRRRIYLEASTYGAGLDPLSIAARWAELQCADPMAGQSPEGLPVVWRLVDHMAVLPTVVHMVEPRCAGLTAEQPS